MSLEKTLELIGAFESIDAAVAWAGRVPPEERDDIALSLARSAAPVSLIATSLCYGSREELRF